MARKKRKKTKAGTGRRGKKLSRNEKIVIVLSISALLILSIALYRNFHSLRKGLYHNFDDPAFSRKYTVRGVDVSHHNSYINWEQLRKDNVTFVYLKSTEGSNHEDREYPKNHKSARNAGLRVGTYHFYTFGLDGKKQARHFIKTSKVVSGDLIPAIDVEHSPTNKIAKSAQRRKKVIEELRVMETELRKHYGVKPVIYTNKDCYILYVKDHFPDNPIWLCDLLGEPRGEFDKWAFWQFSHTGRIPAAADDIDLNYFRYSFDEFKNYLMP